MVIRIIFIFSFLFVQHLLSGQSPFKLKHINISDGLSNNTIRAIFQDSKGYMWFGSDDGLTRYDAYNFKTFRNRINDSTSLPYNYILAINEDKNGNILIGTGQGLVSYNDANGLQRQYYTAYNNHTEQLFATNIFAIEILADGSVLIGSNDVGFFVKHPGEKAAKQIPFYDGKTLKTDFFLQAFTVDTKNKVWLFLREKGLALYDQKNRRIVLVSNLGNTGPVNKMVPDQEGNLWLGTAAGLYQYSIAENRVINSWQASPGKLSSNYITGLSFDGKKNLWVTTQGGGINILNPITGAFRYIFNTEDVTSLTSQNTTTIFIDNEDRKWIGTLRGGINVIDEMNNRFASLTHRPFDKNSLANNIVNTMAEDGEDLWLGTDGEGISRWNRRLNSFINYKKFSNNTISNIIKDSKGFIWIATFCGGIYQYNKTSGAYKHYTCYNAINGHENKIVLKIYEDKQKNIWAATYENGWLYKLNTANNQFEVFDQSIGDIFSIYEDSNGNLWAGSFNELIKIDRINKKHQRFSIGKTVRAIFEDSYKNLWVGAEGGGLLLIDTRNGQIKRQYSEKDGLCNNSVLNILQDNSGNLWLSTFNGLSQFNPKYEKFTNFYENDGLQSNQFTYRGALRLENGEMAFGTIAGVNIFNPNTLNFRNYMPPLNITGISINNKPLLGNKGYKIIAENGTIQNISVPHNQAFLSFDFAALDYSTPDKIKYAYYLDNWDKSWNYTQNRSVTYNNIREGKYTLRIKSTNSLGEWNPKETTLSIIILPPWYRSGWAYLLYFAAAASAIYFYVRYQAKKHKLEFEIKLARQNAENEKELSERKASFFTNISHEFRTLLTLIVNPIKDLMQEEEVNDRQEDIKIVYRNSRRMLGLVDQLLLFRKTDMGNEPITVSVCNFYEMCKEVFDSFLYQARSKKINYTLQSSSRNIELFADADKIEIAIFNLISNAIKFTPDGGSVNLNIEEDANTIFFTISDNGKGFSEDVKNKIFNKYYQIRTLEKKSKPGFGIGLYLVKNFVELHKGIITVESEPGKGTKFYIELQKGKKHFDNTQIIDGYDDGKNQLIKELIADHAEEQASVKLKVVPEAITSGMKTLLIADDNVEIRDYVSGIFKNEYKILEAENGAVAFGLVVRFSPDVVISDLLMPEMEGDELCNKIKNNPGSAHIPVILLTASDSEEAKLTCVKCGADDFIQKPFEKEMLVARVNNLVKVKSSLEKYFYNEITHNTTDLKVSEQERLFIDRCIEIVEDHLYDEQFAIAKLATEMGMSHSSLYKKLKNISGQTVSSFVRFVRLRKAAEYFINSANNVNEVAAQVGFNDIKYFRTQFTKIFKMSPSAYIKKYRKPFQKKHAISRELKETRT